MKVTKDKKKGISLIVLVITIIVIVVLASAIVLAVSNSNSIGKARKSAFQSDINTMREELKLYISAMNSQALGDYDSSQLHATSDRLIENGEIISGKNITNVITTINNKYIDKIAVQAGTLAYVGNNKQEMEWANEFLYGITGGEIVDAEGNESGSVTLKNSLNQSLVDYKIYGNSQQNGDDNVDQLVSVGDKVTDATDIGYGMYKIPVTIVGRNLFNKNGDINRRSTNEIPTIPQSNTLTADGNINIQCSWSAHYPVGQWIEVEPGKTYTIGATLVSCGTTQNTPSLTLENEKNSYSAQMLVRVNMPQNNRTYCTTYTPQTNKVLLGFNKGSGGYGNTGCIVKDVFFIEGEYVLDNLPNYEGYKEETVNIYLKEPLRKLNDDYVDYLDFKNRMVVRNVEEVNGTLKGLEEPKIEILKLPNILLFEHTSKIEVDTEIKPSDIKVTYYQK